MRCIDAAVVLRVQLAAELETAAKTRVSVATNLDGRIPEEFLPLQITLARKIRSGLPLTESDIQSAYIPLADAISRIGQDYRLPHDVTESIRDSILNTNA